MWRKSDLCRLPNCGLAMNQFAIMFEDRINLTELHSFKQNF